MTAPGHAKVRKSLADFWLRQQERAERRRLLRKTWEDEHFSGYRPRMWVSAAEGKLAGVGKGKMRRDL